MEQTSPSKAADWMASEMCVHVGSSKLVCVCVCFTHTPYALVKLVGWGEGRVGGGCHGDSNTPVALPTCLPGPNLMGEGGEKGKDGGERESAEMVGAGGRSEGEATEKKR